MRGLIFLKQNSAKITLLLSLFWLSIIFVFSPHYISSGIILESWAISKGMILYKDMASFHFPMGRIVTLILHQLNNWDLRWDPFLGLFVGVASMILIYNFGKKFLKPAGQIISLLFFTLWFWYLSTGVMFFHEEVIGLLLIIDLTLLFSFIKQKVPDLSKLILLGLSLSVTELFGQVASVTVATFFLLAVYIIFSKIKGRAAFKAFLGLMLGAVIPLIPFTVYFYLNNALSSFFYWNVLYYVDYESEKASLFELPFLQLLTFFSPILLSLYSLLLIKSKLWNFFVFSTLIISISSIPFIVFSIFHYHHLSYALPVLALCAGLAVDKLDIKKISSIFIFGIWSAFVLFTLITTILPWQFSHTTTSVDFSIRNILDRKVNDPENSMIDWIDTNTKPNDKILVIGDSLLYYYSDRLPATRPSQSIPFSWVPFDKVSQEILSHPAKYLIIDQQFLNRLISSYHEERMVDFVNNKLSECYQPAAVFENWQIKEYICH